MRTLTTNLADISFVSREMRGGRVVGNKCGRDFLYYGLHYYFPDLFSADGISPTVMEQQSLLGPAVPTWLAWTMVQFMSAPRYLHSQGIRWYINNRLITNYRTLVSAIMCSRITYEAALRDIKCAINANEVVGIDLSLGWGGLLDHVLFVYGYDDEVLYVFDTHQVPGLEYEPICPDVYFALPKSVIRKRWTRFGRVWRLQRDT
jgi:hypothetical protein